MEQNVTNKATHQNTRKRVTIIVGTGIFAAISTLLYIIKTPPFVFPIFPGMFSFLEINFSEVPALIAGFAYGPISGFIVLLVRFLLKLPFSTTMYVGEFADIIYSSAFVVTASVLYKNRRTFKGAIVSLSIAFVVQVIVSAGLNYFVIHELYNNMFFGGHIPFTAKDFVLVVIPFNIIKNTIISILTIMLYKRTATLINQLF